MGLFNRKPSKNNGSRKERMDNLAKKVKEFVMDENNDDISVSFIVSDRNNGHSLIKGEEEVLTNAFIDIYKKDETFRTLFKGVNKRLSEASESKLSIDDSMFFKGMSPEKITLPDGGEGIALDADNLTDENVNKIIEMILKSNKERGNES